jgi:RimJ/RimL family protein N-acetyltransferase
MACQVTLRDVHYDDLPVFYAHQRDLDAIRMADFPSREYDSFMAHWTRCLTDETAILKTVVADGAVAGNIVCWQQDNSRKVGYWLGKEYWGQGITTSALAQFVELIAERPLYAHVAQSNIASIRVVQKCGFVACGQGTFGGVPGDPKTEIIFMLEPT